MIQSKALQYYLALEKVMLEMEEDHLYLLAEELRNIMDKLWHQYLTNEDHSFLDKRVLGLSGEQVPLKF